MSPVSQSAAVDLIRRLVGFDTTSFKSNLGLVEFIRDYLSDYGVDSRLVFDESGKKANLFATLGPADVPGIVLSGHTDVVPVKDQEWSTDPFTLTEKNDSLFGRGSADMKSFIACALALVPHAAERTLRTPLHLALSYDEEVGCIGVRRLLEDLSSLAVKPAACIVGEPTGMKVVRGHKGKRSLTCRARGLEGHSALGAGVNAIEVAAEIISFLRGLDRRFAAEGPFDPAFEPPRTTVHTGVIEGGTALNIVPRDCRFEFEIRHLPNHDPEGILGEIKKFAETALLPEMRNVSEKTGIVFSENSGFPGLDTEEKAPVTALARTLSGSNATSKVSFGTEAGLFHKAGIPAVVCGPGSIHQAHKPDEFVTLEQIGLCTGFMDRLLEHIAPS